MDAVRVCVVGAAGYAGAEVCRYVAGHPAMELVMATARAEAGAALASVYAALIGSTDVVLVEPDAEAIAEASDLAFLAVPHTAALALAPALLSRGVSVVDLSADYRLADPAAYRSWYGTEHTSPELLSEAVYGLPELHRGELAALAARRAAGKAVLVAAPGCYPTAAALACAPFLETGLPISSPVIVDAISGVSGAGRSASARTHFCHADESVEAYGVATHRHTPEIAQSLSWAAGHEVGVVFTPHLGPYKRGILATCYLQTAEPLTVEEAHAILARRYGDEPLVDVLAIGEQPATAAVEGSAKALLGVAVDARTSTLIITCAIDNLGKGAAAQAVQCANAILGLPEETGLLRSLPPVV